MKNTSVFRFKDAEASTNLYDGYAADFRTSEYLSVDKSKKQTRKLLISQRFNDIQELIWETSQLERRRRAVSLMKNIKSFAFFKPSMNFVMMFQSIANISNRQGMHFKCVICSKMLIFVSQFCYLYI